jgi:hypothetical protein
MQRIAMTPLAGIASGVERGLQAVGQIEQNRQAKQTTAMNDLKLQEAQAKEADLNRVTTKQILFDNLQMGENVRSSVEPFYAMFANPDGNISKRNTFEMMKFLESNPMAKQKMLEGRHADVQKEYDTSKAELEEIKLSGNEKKIQQATQKFNIASQKLSGITQSMTDEKGNRLQLVSKYGAAAEKFFNGEYTPDEFAKAVQEQELAKQKAKDAQAIEKVKEVEKIRTESKERIEAMKQANKTNTDKLSDREKKTVETAFKYEGAARKKLDELNKDVPEIGTPERVVYEKKANALVDIIKQQMKIHQDIINKGGQSGADKFGYSIGEVRKGHKYVGNDQWQKL